MHAVTFDTLRLAQRLRDEAKFPPEQAEKAASVLADTFSDWQSQQRLATQDDIQKLQMLIEQKASDTIKWVVGLMVAQTGLLLGVLKMHG